MKRERISDIYEDFEPEIRIWPFVALGFLIPLVPLLLSLAFNGTIQWTDILMYSVSVLPLVFASAIMKDGERAWLLTVSGGLYGAAVLLVWIEKSLSSHAIMPLGIPLSMAVSPSLLSFSSYVFFQKRKRGKWAGVLVLSIMLSAALLFFSGYTDGEMMTMRMVYPALLLVLLLSLFLVTRRSDSTPWFITILLSLLLLSSSLFHSGILSMVEGGEKASFVSVVLGVFVHDNEFWYTLSFLFVFASLASKSSYRTVIERVETKGNEGEDMEGESFSVPPVLNGEKRDPRYSYPPDDSRFSPESSEERVVPPSVEAEEPREPRQPSYQETRREERNGAADDKWYDFLEGGVRNERRPAEDRYRETQRRDYSDRDRYRDDIIYGDRRRDDRPRYDDYRDERPRYRDDRDYRSRDYRDVMDDRDDYRPRRDDRAYDDRYRDDRDWDRRRRDDYPERRGDYRRDDRYYDDRRDRREWE